jgi:hypothetical protein
MPISNMVFGRGDKNGSGKRTGKFNVIRNSVKKRNPSNALAAAGYRNRLFAGDEDEENGWPSSAPPAGRLMI